MKSLTLLLFWVALASCLFAQKEVTVTSASSSESDKVVTVEVQKEGNDERKVTIVVDEDGEMQTIEWTDNGAIPDNIKKELAEKGIDIEMIGGNGDERRVMVKVDGDGDSDVEVHKNVIVIKDGDDGEVKEFSWDGEGEMPAEMKELMEKHDIDMDMLHEGEGKHKMRRTKMRVKKDEMKKMRHREHRKGRDIKAKHKKEYKVVKIGEDGKKEVKVWVDDEGGTHDLHDTHGNVFFHSEGEDDGNVFIMKGDGGNWTSKDGHDMFFSSRDGQLSDAYIGAHIESADTGARIVELIKDGPADKAGLQKGDVIERINGARARSMDGLLNILNYFEPSDKVELTISRGGNEKTVGLTLGERPDSMR